MARRMVLVAVALVASSWSVLAAVERATFILTSGERISGNVVYHTESRENLIGGYLNIGTSDGKEQTFRQEQVAVIDFIGGTPSNNELSALPDGAGQLLVMRDGSTRDGQFVNMIAGTTVKWRERNGSVQDLPIMSVARIYLNADSARNTFNYTGGRRTANTVGGDSGGAQSGEIAVQANRRWTDTGMTVNRGDIVRFTTRGQIRVAQGSQTTGPDGSGGANPSFPVPGMGVGGLVARVANSAPFPIGSNTNGITMPADGRLMLGVNDDILTDNSGAFYVQINRNNRNRR